MWGTLVMGFRIAGLVIASATLWWPSSSLALGLGELTVESTLASPFKANIPLTGMSRIDLEPGRFFIKLDSESKPKLLYRFELTNTTAKIIIYSRKAITDPLFDFRIQVEWDTGKVARRYDVLVDPVSYNSQSPVKELVSTAPDETSKLITSHTAAAPSTGLPVSEASTTPPVVKASPAKLKTNIKEIADSDPEFRQNYGPTVSGNSLWRVARKARSENELLTIYQWMHGIWKENPQAFINLNMHRLKVDRFLRVPFEWEVEKTTHRAAHQIYVEHQALIQPPDQTTVIVKAEEPIPEAEIESEIAEDAVPEVAITSVDVVPDLVDENPVVKEEAIFELLEVSETEGVIETPIVQDITGENDSQGSALKSRGDFIDQLPIIGANGPFDIIGRAIRQLDGFISSSSSWVSLAIGGLAALLLVLLSRMFRSRPEPASNVKLKVKEPVKVSEPVLGVSPRREATEALVTTAEDTVKIERPQHSAGVDDFMDSLVDEDKSDESDNKSSAHEEPSKMDLLVSEAMLEADVLAAYGDTDKAVELLQTTMEIQPDMSELKVQLLKMYYKKHDAEAFEALIAEIRPTIAELDSREVARLQVMYSALCPDSSPLIVRDDVIDPNRVVRALEIEPDSTEEGEGLDVHEQTELENLAEGDSGDSKEIKNPEEDELVILNEAEEAIDEAETFDALDLLGLEDADVLEEPIPDEIGIETDEAVSAESTSNILDDLEDDDNYAETQVMEVGDQAIASEESLDDGGMLLDTSEGEIVEKDTVQAVSAEEEPMEFMRVEDIELETDPAVATGESEELLVENLIDEVEDNSYSQPVEGRVLHFPNSPGRDDKSSEFEAELMNTLQAMRDQMQQMNERLFSQERENYRLRKVIEELSDNHPEKKRPKKA
ncbi:MAG: FimV-like protein [Gammaproteobacteria bacterium]